jgi:hypothetical protein
MREVSADEALLAKVLKKSRFSKKTQHKRLKPFRLGRQKSQHGISKKIRGAVLGGARAGRGAEAVFIHVKLFRFEECGQ